MKTARTSSAGPERHRRTRRKKSTRSQEKRGRRVPSLRQHRASGQGYVVLNGRAIYVGKYGEEATTRKYHQVVAEWVAAGRALPVDPEHITIKEVIARFWLYAEKYYVWPDARPTSEIDNFKAAFRPLKQLYAATKACEFGPLATAASSTLVGPVILHRHQSAVPAEERVRAEQRAELAQEVPAQLHGRRREAARRM